MAGFTYAPDETPQKPQGSGFTYGESEAPVQTYEPEKITEEPLTDPMTGMPVGTQRVITPPNRLYEDLPTVAELPLSNAPSFGSKAQAQAGLLFSSTPEGAANVIRETMPGARFALDKYNNPIVIAKDEEGKEQRYHLDKPGINALDVSRGVARGVAAAPLAAGAATIAPAATVGLPLAALSQFGGASVSSLLGDVLASKMGSEEKPSMEKALIEGGIGAAIPVAGAGIKTLARLFEPDIFNTMSRGAQNFIKQYADKFKSGDVPMPSGGRDIVLDSPQFKAVAQSIIQEAPDSPAAKIILQQVESREAQTVPRIRSDMDSIIGKATVSEREADEAYKAYMRVLSGEETPILKNAPPVDPSGIVAKIDAMLPNAQGKTASALRNIRSMFVESEGAAGTAGGRTPVIDPVTKKVIRYEQAPSQPATPPKYKTSAEALENARTEIDSLIKWGDESLGIRPGELKGKEAAIGSLRKDLSDLLKKNVPGYDEVMGKFQNVHNQIEANKIGQQILKAGANDIRPDQVALLLRDPETASALRTSVRALIENKLSRSPNDIAALKTILGGEQDYNRRSLELLFGKKEVNRLAQIVDRELGYRETADALMPSRAVAQGKEAAEKYAESRAPLVTVENIRKIPEKTIARPVDILYQKAKGTYGEAYPKSLSEFMTAPAEKVPEYLRGMEKQQTLEKAIQRAQQFGAGPLEAAPFASQRTERKSGGRVDAKAAADKLIRAAEVAKKNIGKQTETILDAPDEHVVKALAVANKTFEG
jgi:hypothetical protein